MLSNIRGQYEVRHEIGAGGMGKVYVARDNKLNRQVALKILLPDHSRDPERRRRFFLEAQAASALNHPNIITIYDIVTEEVGDVMVMEYVQGKTLVDVIPRGGLRVPQVINYGLQIADALHAAHSAGIIHRDLKPGNIMITDRGLVKILDFGLAKLTEIPGSQDPDATNPAPLTVEGALIGTLCYMSPEQAQGRKVDARSDIFAFGAVLYEMATGQRAFTGDNSIGMLSSILRDEPPSMIEVAPDIPDQLEHVIRRCLRKDPDDRWQSMADVHRALTELKHASDSGVLYRSRSQDAASSSAMTFAGPPSAAQRTIPPLAAAPTPAPAPPARSSKGWLAAVAAIVVVALAGAGAWYWQTRLKPAEPAAESAPPDAVKPAPSGLSNDAIIEMVAAKVPENVIVSQIRSSPGANFDLSAGEVIRLAKNGVSERIIETMRNPLRAQGTAPAAVPSPSGSPGATSLPPAAQEPASPAPAPSSGRQVTLAEGTPVQLLLDESVLADVEPGARMNFVVSADVTAEDAVVVAKGAAASGVVLDRAKKRFLGLGSRPAFEFVSVEAVDGSQVAIRAIQQKPKDDEAAARAIDSPGSKPKGVLAAKGAMFIAYVAASRPVSPKK